MALKANVHEIAHTYQTAYPNAKVLYPGKNDFTPANRVKLFNEIKNNDWDVVILTHDQFGKIPQSPEVQQTILQNELDSVEESLDVLREQGRDISRAMLKGLEKRKQNLEVKLENIAHSINERTDDVVDFKQMGIDHIFVDESHKFKNLMFSTKHTSPCYYLAINQLHSIILQLGAIWKRAKVFTLRFIAYSSMNNLLGVKVVN